MATRTGFRLQDTSLYAYNADAAADEPFGYYQGEGATSDGAHTYFEGDLNSIGTVDGPIAAIGHIVNSTWSQLADIMPSSSFKSCENDLKVVFGLVLVLVLVLKSTFI